ncbi:hypothetical protein [Streptomyces sp. Ag109_G2-15]|uniref:DUF6959 family protein n=1 Tax=Streptomyces sp. Ag109_G2-15 TaxID=1938850 RepID=UPI00359CAF0E
MERVEAELFTDGGNDAVIRLSGRRFPGVLIQGDSLRILRSDLAEVVEACERGDLADARDSAGQGASHLRRPSMGVRGCPPLCAGAVTQLDTHRPMRRCRRARLSCPHD